jgi:hypothetical protein
MLHRTVVAGAVLVCALGFLLWSLTDADAAIAVGSPVGEAPGPGPAAAAAAGTEAAPAADSAPDAQRIAAAAAAAPAAAAEAEPVALVRVVDAAELPVPDAEVAWSAEPGPPGAAWAREQERRAWAAMTVRTDGRGEVRVPVPAEAVVTVFARCDDRWGSLLVAKAAAAPALLRLRRDVTLRVQVRDGRDRPVVGARVGIHETPLPGRSAAVDVRTEAPHGIATFAHVQEAVAEAWQGRGFVSIDEPLPAPVHAAVDFAGLPELVVLRLPDTGSVRVTLATGDGPFEPLGDAAFGTLAVERPGAAGAYTSFAKLPRGVLELEHVGLGLQFRLEMDGEECSGALSFAGPTVAGERLAYELRVEPRPIVAGRLVDEARAPLRGSWLATHVQDTPAWSSQYFETGADGRFAFRLVQVPAGEAGERGMVIRRARSGAGEERAFVDLRSLPGGAARSDVGELVVQPPPLLVEGRVVDPSGQGLADAMLRVLQTNVDGSEVWSPSSLAAATVRSAADGAFAMRGHVVGRRLSLLAWRDGRAGEPVPFGVPTTGLVYVLQPVGAIEADVVLAADLAADDLWFAVRGEGTGRALGRAASHVLKQGRLHWGGLEPGRYRLDVGLAASAGVLCSVRDVEVRGGEVTTLPPLELVQALHRVTLAITDRDGHPVPRAHLVVDPDAPSERPRLAVAARGRLSLCVDRLPFDLLVLAPGHRARRVRVEGDQVISLDPGLVVRVQARVADGALADGERLVPLLERAVEGRWPDLDLRLDQHLAVYDAARESRLWRRDVALDRAGRAEFTVPGPGDYVLSFELETANDRVSLPMRPRRFTVLDAADATSVEVDVEVERAAK